MCTSKFSDFGLPSRRKLVFFPALESPFDLQITKNYRVTGRDALPLNEDRSEATARERMRPKLHHGRTLFQRHAGASRTALGVVGVITAVRAGKPHSDRAALIGSRKKAAIRKIAVFDVLP